MNVAIFITLENIEDIRRMVDSLSERQFEPVNGALVVIHEESVRKEEAISVIEPLMGVEFPVRKIMSVCLTSSIPQERKSGILFHNFAVGCYCKFPGPWLLIDSYSASVARNPITIMERHYEAAGKLCCGRSASDLDIRHIVPIGPVVINLPFSRIVYAGYIARGWRETLSVTINRSIFHTIKESDFPFSDNDSDPEKEIETKVSAGTERSYLENLSEEELDNEYENALGVRPHARTKRLTKISRILEMQ